MNIKLFCERESNSVGAGRKHTTEKITNLFRRQNVRIVIFYFCENAFEVFPFSIRLNKYFGATEGGEKSEMKEIICCRKFSSFFPSLLSF